ncbi:hypothetical protein EKO27_g8117 [Xylaria grammica]|uniref:Uncharacterized protein n=1 Tax=Xylaria grammica TaxID=363999 RepID=A0A439CYB7_9PEZI|nr:hypothetical protein EKO27_g8117 [Xylaria grammica]
MRSPSGECLDTEGLAEVTVWEMIDDPISFGDDDCVVDGSDRIIFVENCNEDGDIELSDDADNNQADGWTSIEVYSPTNDKPRQLTPPSTNSNNVTSVTDGIPTISISSIGPQNPGRNRKAEEAAAEKKKATMKKREALVEDTREMIQEEETKRENSRDERGRRTTWIERNGMYLMMYQYFHADGLVYELLADSRLGKIFRGMPTENQRDEFILKHGQARAPRDRRVRAA